MDEFNELNIEETPQPVSLFKLNFEKMIRDMRFVGIFVIIYGALACLSIIGAIIGVPIIIIGLRIREAAEQFEIYKATNQAAALRMGFELQGKYFRLAKIIIIVSLIITALWFIFILGLLISGFHSFYQLDCMDYNSIGLFSLL
ncbi:hypothetical protein MROS_0494 [Melioribacter roseus P3M-2]|uniref:DUF5362 domain-containing protein n=1 Tax=Melioribacter roseus (strain DSM 23840 / JCM 17771 / VKM B-2668 / P3M-2) TaxID=1191523 RepID=I6YT55_MELRP|nr:DUF5362 domain-containing protein [Melioribacter roseus]AFN73737.1 hypothetical protein MROS_0494 [Melioribacter roseus P3M-2]